MDIAELGYSVDSSDLEKAVKLLDRLEAAGARAGRSGTKLGNGIEKGAKKASGSLLGLSAVAMKTLKVVGMLAGVTLGAGLVAEVGRMADAWSDMTSQVRLNIGATEDAAQVMDRLYKVARTTYSSIEQTTESFTRNSTTLRALGRDTRGVLDYTTALNNALVVSGAKAQAAESVQNAMAKAMATGSLRGEELNTVLNSGSRIAQLLAEELGTNVVGLRAMGKQGKITGDILYNSLVRNMELLTEEAESMPATIGDAFVLLKNSVMRAVGVMDQRGAFSESLAGMLIDLADFVDRIPKIVDEWVGFFRGAFRDLRQMGREAWEMIGVDSDSVLSGMSDNSKSVLSDIANEFMILPVSMRTIVTILIGETDKLLAGAQRSFSLMVVAGKEAWLSLQSSGSEMASRVEGFFIAMARSALGQFGRMVTAAAAIADKVGATETAEGLRSLAESLGNLVPSEAELAEAMAKTAAEFDRRREGLKKEVAAIEENAKRRRMFADDAIQAALDEREAALARVGATEAMIDADGELSGVMAGATALTKEQLEDIKKLAAAELAAARSRIELAGAANDMAAAESAYKIAVMDANAEAAKQLAVGMRWATVEEQLSMSIAVAVKNLDARTAAVRENQRAHKGLLAMLSTERKLIAMSSGDRDRYIARLRAEEEMQKAVAVAREAGAEISDEMAAGFIEEAGAVAEANEELAQYIKHLSDIGMDDAKIRIVVEGLDGENLADPLWDAVKASDALRDALQGAFSVTPAQRLRDQIEALTKAIKIEGLTSEQVAAIDRQRGEKRQQLLETNIALVGDGIASLKSMAGEGTKAYAALEAAQAALNLVTAIGAVVNQGMGDPYTAFARMAAMAAAVSQLVGSLGSIRGFSGGAADRQRVQGTGTVLGDEAAKSESIARGVEITANATQQLVGINRGMLSALQSMQAGIGGASTLLARGAGDQEFTNFGPAQHNLFNRIGIGLTNIITGGLFGSLIDSISRTVLGARSEITDTGILIGGGMMSQLMQGITVGSYQEVQSRSWWFGSTRTNEQVQSLDPSVGRQFQLVLNSMADAVREAALAMGMGLDEIEARIAAFQIEEIRISTMDLSAEEAQKELEAVFSSIFDGLAAHVVPYIEQFQLVGEGMAETLIRVATGIQVTQEAVRQLGFALDEADPERFAQISEHLISLVGGVDDFISGMSDFVDAFASDEHKFFTALDSLTRAFDQVGLAVPESRDAMWELMQSLDATTEAGREQIATLLRLAGVADAYYSMLEDREAGRGFDGGAGAIAAIIKEIDDAIEAVGLSDHELAIRRVQAEVAEFVDALTNAGMSLEDATAEANRYGEAMLAVLEQQRLAAEAAGLLSLNDWAADLRAATGELSVYGKAMRDAERWREDAIAEANRLARAAGLAGARVEDLASIELRHAQMAAEAARILDNSARDLISQLYGPTEGSLDDILARIAAMEASSQSAFDSIGSGIQSTMDAWMDGLRRVRGFLDSMLLDSSITTLTPEEQLDEATAQFDRLLALANAGDADALAELPDMAQTVLDLARAFWSSGDEYTAIFDGIRSALQDLPTAVATGAGPVGGGGQYGVSPELQSLYEERDRLLAEQEAANRLQMAQQLAAFLVEMAESQEQPILDLARALGVKLEDFVTDLGVDLSNVSVATVQQLAALARMLGVSLSDLAGSVGVSIGALTDQYSLAAGALAADILQLPEGVAGGLRPYLDAIADATSDADASAATEAMADYISTLDDDIRSQLAPYFDGLAAGTTGTATAVSVLADVNRDILSHTAEHTALLGRILATLGAANNAAGVPSYAVGVGTVPHTGLAMIHQGETIIPAQFATWLRSNGFPLHSSGGADDELVGILIDEIADLKEEVRAGANLTASASRSAGDAVSNKIDDQTRQQDQRNRELVTSISRRER